MKGLFKGAAARRSQQPGSSSSSNAAALQKMLLPLFPSPPVPDRKLKVIWKEDGLAIVPANATSGATAAAATKIGESSSSSQGAFIKWGRKSKVQPVKLDELLSASTQSTTSPHIECHGIVGILRMFNSSYLFVITRREHAGDFLHHFTPVYKCTGVLAIPLVKDTAANVLKQEFQDAQKYAKATAAAAAAAADSSSEEGSDDEGSLDDPAAQEASTPSLLRRSSYFSNAAQRSATLSPSAAAKWQLNRSSPRSASETHGQPVSPGVQLPAAEHSTVEQGAPPALPQSLELTPTSPDEQVHQDPADQEANKAELEDKLIKEASRQYARGEMLFSYDFDLTTSLQRKYEEVVKSGVNPGPASSSPSGAPFEEPRGHLPLWKRAERKFWHNEYMSKDFVNAGLDSMVLPLMQGFFQTSPLDVHLEEGDQSNAGTSAQLLIVSRRSRERPGLRYQRRGINESGQVANFVETEQVLMVKRAGQTHLFTFVQFRGSIPLFWSQSPFSMKPPPLLERSKEENMTACAKHFEVQTERYGDVTCINLAEQGGKEGEITEAYRRTVTDLERSKNPKVHYHAFDFHKECAGMKFENVSKLIDLQKHRLEEMDCFWRAWGMDSASSAEGNSGMMTQQRGIFRVNCIDCLDRTNVVQSAFGRHMLQAQFARIGIHPQQHPAFDLAFYDMWANNGDQVSQCYAGSRALKSVRGGKRNLFGMMNDATASVYRMVQGAITDFWRQAVISFTYGELSLSHLERFSDDLQAADPSNETRLARIRAVAIETCASMVLHQDNDSTDGDVDGEAEGSSSSGDVAEERKIGGWALFSPLELNTIQSSKLEEKIVILSDKALYICSYDFTAEKFCEYTRVRLGDILRIQKGPYVISPRDGYHPEQHWGLVVHYGTQSTRTRLNVASVRNVPPPPQQQQETSENFVALKAVADDFAGTLERDSDGDGNGAAEGGDVVEPGQGDGSSKTKRKWFSKRNANVDHSTIANARSIPASAAGTGNGNRATSDTLRSQASLLTLTPDGLTSHQIVNRIVAILTEECALSGACTGNGEEDGFVQEKSIQSLAQAKANAPLFGGLIEGLKRRVWL